MSREPPSTARLVALLARVALRRMGNRIASRSLIFRRRRGGADGKARGATPGKSTGSVLFLSALGVLFLFQGMMISGQLLGRIGLTVAREGDPGDLRFPVHASSYRSLVGLKQRLDEFHERHSRQASSPPEELDRFVEDRMTELRGELTVEIHSAGKWRASSDGDWKLSDEGEAKLAEMVRAFRERGPDAFRSLPPRRAHFLPDALHWPEPAGERAFLLALGVLLTILFSSLLCVSLGSANQDLGRVEWSMEWLYSFPVTARSLFLAKILEYTIVTAFPWFTLFPLSLTIFWAAGYQWWAVALALMTTLYLNLLLASLRFTAETWLRKRLSLARLKNLQALFTVLGLLLLYLVLYVAIRDELPAWVLGAARGVPGAILWSPVALPLLLTAKNAAVALLLPLLLVAGGGFLAAGSVASARVVRDGLLSAGGPYQGSRRKPRSGDRPSSWSWAMSGILGKEMRLLARDRNFLVQTLVVPLLIIGFQVLINPQLVGAVSGNFRHGATLAFGIGAYVLMFGGCSVLTVEGSSLWLLYTFPRPLGTILRQKALLWSIAGGFYVTVILSVVAVNAERLDGTTLAAASMALAGVVIYAFIAAGLGILGTNPLEQEVRRKIRPGTMYLYMLLASMYAYG
ncbi:MAG: hypothetical protein ACE5GW_10475, partial [Planctomycetota bacterium]